MDELVELRLDSPAINAGLGMRAELDEFCVR
jgi:hypothetical protein